MAVAIATTSGHRLDWGSIDYNGLTAITIAITFKFNASPSGRRICGSWTGSGAWLMAMSGDEIAMVVNGPAPCGLITDAADCVDGGLYRVVLKLYDLAGTPSRKGFVNGASVAVSTFIGNNVGAISHSASVTRVGDTDGSVPENADYSEFAIWPSELPDADCLAYTLGFSPLLLSVKPMLYARLTNTDDIHDLVGGRTCTNTSGTTASHPAMAYPHRRATVQPGAASGAMTCDIGLVGTLAGAPSGAGALQAAVGLPGALAGEATGAGALQAAVSLPGTLAGTLTGVGALEAGLSGVGTLAGTATGSGALAADISGPGTLLGVPSGAGSLVAAIDGVGTLAGTLTGNGALQVDVSLVLTMTGDMGGGAMLGPLGGVGTLAGELTGAGAMTCAMGGVGTLLGVPTATVAVLTTVARRLGDPGAARLGDPGASRLPL